MTKSKAKPANSVAEKGDTENHSEPLARRTRGRAHEEASFPVAPPKAELPESYATSLSVIKERIQKARLKTVLAANSAMILLYWDVGQLILERQRKEGWGARVIDRLSQDLREAYPDMKGLSSRNLKYMRSFAAAWPAQETVQEVLAQITWYHNVALLEKLKDPQLRIWYANKAAQEGWSRNILAMQIKGQLHEREGMAINNFSNSLPPEDSDMASQVFKDPYLFDFLGTADPRREQEVEQALMDHIQQFLLELGAGFAFVGRQVQVEVGGQDFVVDLLFYHLKLRCYVVIELKAVPFSPAFVGQLNVYLSAVDDLLKHPDDKPTIGLLLCKEKNKMVVEYALRDLNKPIGVAEWETHIVEQLPEDLKGSLPTVKELEAEFIDLPLNTGSEK